MERKKVAQTIYNDAKKSLEKLLNILNFFKAQLFII